jgi:cytidine deaminase
MTIDIEALIAAALEARTRAYAPYSGYHVGCAVSAGGQVFLGANIENASYGLTLCAERAAVSIAVLAGHRRIDAVALATASSPPAAPCGMCLQTLAEFAADPAALPLYAVNDRGERQTLTLKELLPHGFTGAALRTKA